MVTGSTAFVDLVRALAQREARYVLIGVWGANFHAPDPAAVLTTLDYDLFLPPDAANLVSAWEACGALDMAIQADGAPLGAPRDEDLARRVLGGAATTRAVAADLVVDLSPSVAAFEFDTVWEERRMFLMEGVEIPVARLSHIIRSKAATNRAKDRLFLATHADVLRRMLDTDED